MTSVYGEREFSLGSISIRAATPDDVPKLLALVNAAYRVSEGHVFPTTDRVERTEAMTNLDRIAIAEIDGKIAACIDIDLSGEAAHFGMLSADVALQKRGIGSLLIEYAERQARAAGHAVMRIEVVKEAGRVPWYERKGYRVTRETPGQVWNGGLDWGAVAPWHMVDMEKPLRSTGAPARPAKVPDATFASGVRLRTGTLADADALVRLINEAYLRESWLLPAPRVTQEQMRRYLSKDDTCVIVAEHNGEIAGSLRLSIEYGDQAWFGLLATSVAYQGRGLASMLIARAEAWACDHGYDALHLDCAEELGLPSYYASLGYSVVSREEGFMLGPGRGPITRIVMSKRLK